MNSYKKMKGAKSAQKYNLALTLRSAQNRRKTIFFVQIKACAIHKAQSFVLRSR